MQQVSFGRPQQPGQQAAGLLPTGSETANGAAAQPHPLLVPAQTQQSLGSVVGAL